jgi:hypothetical protein
MLSPRRSAAVIFLRTAHCRRFRASITRVATKTRRALNRKVVLASWPGGFGTFARLFFLKSPALALPVISFMRNSERNAAPR